MSLWVSSRAMGRPTDSLRPIIVAFFFSKGSLYDSTKQRVARAEEGRFTIYSSAEISKKREYIVVVNLTVESSFLSATFAISQLEQPTFVGVATSINILDGRDCL